MPPLLRAAFEDLTFMTPLSEQRAEALVDHLVGGLDNGQGTVLDLGCGWAELLLRVVAAHPGIRGIGVDSDAHAIQHGRMLAQARGLQARIDLRTEDASEMAPERVDAVICIGATQIWGPPTEDSQPLDYAAALEAVRATVPRGARVVYGEGVWSRPPTREAIEALGGRTDEFVTMAELVELATGHGFMPLAVHEASLDEWDEFESGYSACYTQWLVDHGLDHPDAAEVQVMAARQRAAYYGGYRGILGLAYLSLVAV